MTGALENCQVAVNVSQDWEASFTFKTLCFVEIILNLQCLLRWHVVVLGGGLVRLGVGAEVCVHHKSVSEVFIQSLQTERLSLYSEDILWLI